MDNRERAKIEQWYYANKYVNEDDTIGKDAPFVLSIPRGTFTWDDGFIAHTDDELEDMRIEMLDGIASTKYINERVKMYPDLTELNDALVKQHSNDDVVKAEGVAQEAKYYQDCLDVKEANPKPE